MQYTNPLKHPVVETIAKWIGVGWVSWFVLSFTVSFVASFYRSFSQSYHQEVARQVAIAQKSADQSGGAQLRPLERQISSEAAAPMSGTSHNVDDLPTNLVCPDGTSLHKVVSFKAWEDNNAQGTEWECIGKPRQVKSGPSK